MKRPERQAAGAGAGAHAHAGVGSGAGLGWVNDDQSVHGSERSASSENAGQQGANLSAASQCSDIVEPVEEPVQVSPHLQCCCVFSTCTDSASLVRRLLM